MNENPNDLSPVEVKKFSDVFEKTLLEISILESLNGSSSITECLKNVFQTFIEDIHNFGTLKTLTGIIDKDVTERCDEKNEHNQEQNYIHYTNDELFVQHYESLRKKMQILKCEEEDIDSIIEKCTVSIFLNFIYKLALYYPASLVYYTLWVYS